MDLSFDSVDSVHESFDSTYDLPGLQCEPTNRECDLTDYDAYVSTASVCEQTEAFDSVHSVYESMNWTYGRTGLQCEPTNQEYDLTDYDPYVSTASVCAQTETFNPVDSVYQSMDWTYGLTGLQCEPTRFSLAPANWEYDLKDYDPYALTEDPFEEKEGKAWRLLAARIPPELFENILFYVNIDRVSQTTYHKMKWNQEELSPKDMLIDLKRCSLVCLFWANRCREHMFSDRTIFIRSYEDAAIFRRYIVGGCPRLTPVHRLIKHIYVIQHYSGDWTRKVTERHISFLHLLYIPAVQGRLEQLFIEGPVPYGFNPAKLDTPHWGIPPSIVVPSSFLQKQILLSNIHLPSFHHVAKYIRHFSCAAKILFAAITWDGQTPTYSLPQASNTITCHRRPRSMGIDARRYCTDSVHLALTALMLNPNCPLHRLSNEERVWMIRFMTLLWGDEEDPGVFIEFNVSEHATTMHARLFHFVFEEAPSTDQSASALSVVGMHAYIYNSDSLPANLDALVHHARTRPTIRALVLLFVSLRSLQESVKPFVQVLSPATETIKLVLAYEMEKQRKAVGVDLVTLEPNGRIWTDLPESDWYEKEHLKSLHILDRQLEKKPRLGRLH